MIAAVLAALIAGCGGSQPVEDSDFSTNTEHPPAADVAITSVEFEHEYATATIGLTVTNNSSKQSSYAITVEFTDDAGTRLGEGYANVESLAAGQTAKAELIGVYTDRPTKARVLEVERFAS